VEIKRQAPKIIKNKKQKIQKNLGKANLIISDV
jgi:hypothetical protein